LRNTIATVDREVFVALICDQNTYFIRVVSINGADAIR